jgi:tripartite-type tricarboxylate transporter receptor subunit TctC
MKIIRRIFNSAIVALLCTGTAAFAQKDTGKLIVGYPAGQSVDAVARLLAERLGPAIGRTLVVENMPGQSGSVALEAVRFGGRRRKSGAVQERALRQREGLRARRVDL